MATARHLPMRLPSSFLFELRAAWARGRRVSLSLDARADDGRLEGHITSVSATGAYVKLHGRHVPTDLILAVHLPSRLGDSNARETFHGPARRIVPQAEELWDDTSALASTRKPAS